MSGHNTPNCILSSAMLTIPILTSAGQRPHSTVVHKRSTILLDVGGRQAGTRKMARYDQHSRAAISRDVHLQQTG